MKRILILAMVALTATIANAAATDWSLTCGNMKDHTGAAFSGLFQLYAIGGDLSSDTLVYENASAGTTLNKVAITVSSGLTPDTDYSFYYIIKDSAGYSLKSETKGPFTALATGAQTIGFGNQATYTSTAGNWSAAPEPTSGLLLVLGLAGLALKRKRS